MAASDEEDGLPPLPPAPAKEAAAGAEVQVTVLVTSGAEVATLALHTEDTVRVLKKAIQKADGTPYAQQRLLLDHAVLSNAQKLGEVGITGAATVQLVRLPPAEVPPMACRDAAVGDGIIVLEESLDPSYEPTEDEIDEYAEWLGMDPDTDGPLMWIAREGLLATLQDPWRVCETADREIFYFNFDTGHSTWDHPIDQMQRAKYRKLKAAQHGQIRPPPQPRDRPAGRRARRERPAERPRAAGQGAPAAEEQQPVQQRGRSTAPRQEWGAAAAGPSSSAAASSATGGGVSAAAATAAAPAPAPAPGSAGCGAAGGSDHPTSTAPLALSGGAV